MIAQLSKAYLRARPTKAWDRLISYTLFEGRPLTTAGRWINPLVFSLFWLEKQLPQWRTIQQPVFILGTGRSGTTLLGVLLSLHHQVGYLNEPKAIWHAIYPQEDLMGSYTEQSAYYRLSAEMATPQAIRAAQKIYASYLLLLGKQRVVDKYPELVFRVPFVKALFPDARFLFIVRDGVDTAVSIKEWSAREGIRRGGQTEDWWGRSERKWHLLVNEVVRQHPLLAPFADDLLQTEDHALRGAVEWLVSMEEGLRQMESYPQDIKLIHYETLAAQPVPVLADILQFLALPPDEAVLCYAREVVKPVARKESFALPPWLQTPFAQMMHRLGYDRGDV